MTAFRIHKLSVLHGEEPTAHHGRDRADMLDLVNDMNDKPVDGTVYVLRPVAPVDELETELREMLAFVDDLRASGAEGEADARRALDFLTEARAEITGC